MKKVTVHFGKAASIQDVPENVSKDSEGDFIFSDNERYLSKRVGTFDMCAKGAIKDYRLRYGTGYARLFLVSFEPKINS